MTPSSLINYPRYITCVEDNDLDYMVILRVFNRLNVSQQINRYARGRDFLIDILGGSGGTARPDLPSLILLDMNLPDISGQIVLDALKSDSRTMHIPVVIFTSSSRPSDVLNCYERGANAYVTKPTDLDEYQEAITNLNHFWLNSAVLP
jgi:CheY-like chemotaxis protein